MKNTIKVTFDEAFERTGYNIRHSRPTLVIGRAGTGKSTLIRKLKNEFPYSCLIAPTNMAAKNIGGRTPHRVWNIPTNLCPNKIPRKYKRPQTIFIDEISAYGQNLLCQTLEYSGEKSNLVMFGDFGQLPPVNDESLYSFLEGEPSVEKLELSHNYRQEEDPEYQETLNNLYENGPTSKRVMEFIDSRTNIPLPKEFVYLATLNADVNAYNKKYDFSVGTFVRGHNNRSRIKNNEMGIIVDSSGDRLWVQLFGGNEVISKNPHSLRAEIVEVSTKDVKIAEGTTIHRIQGKTLSKVVIERNKMELFQASLYVAMSRVRRAEDVFFIDREDRSYQIYFQKLSGGEAGSEHIENSQEIEETKAKEMDKKTCRKKGTPAEINNSANIKKYGSKNSIISILLLNPYYLGVNNEFTVWKRNKLLEKQLGIIERTNKCKSKSKWTTLWEKPKYIYKEIEPPPFFMYSPDCKRITDKMKEDSVYESLNPMKPGSKKRLISNCYRTTRFLFEFDFDLALPSREIKKQRTYFLKKCKKLKKMGIVNRITFSGRRSYHCIVETSYEVPNYKNFWDWINNKYFEGEADKHCKYPSCWTRIPGKINPKTKLQQRGYGISSGVFDPTEELAEMEREAEQKKSAEVIAHENKREKEIIENKPVPRNREEAFKQAVIDNKIARKLNTRAKMKHETEELLKGQFPSDGFIQWATIAINDLHNHGYSSYEIEELIKKAGNERLRKVKNFIFHDRPYNYSK